MSKLKLYPFKDFIISEYLTGKSCQKIADENSWYQQAVSNLLKSEKLYDSYRPNQGNTRYFQYIDSHQKAYLLGFIAADGCLQSNGKNSYGLSITIHSKDISVLECLRSQIGCENQIFNITGKMSHSNKQKDHCRFQLFNKDLYSDLSSYGLTPKKSTTMPNLFSKIPEQYHKSFVVGYFDGDGSVSLKNKRNQQMISFRGTEAFLQGIAIALRLSKFWLYKDKDKECFSLVFWRKSDIISFYNIYKELGFYLERKYQRIHNFLKIDKDQTISPS